MPKTNRSLSDIITNLDTAIREQGIGASRITLNNIDLMSLLLAIQDELDKKQDR